MEKNNSNSISLNKFIASTGLCSRREADKLIKAGKITINKRRAFLGNRVKRGDDVRIDGRKLDNKNVETVYLAFHKPVGIVSTSDPNEKANIVRYIHYPERLFPIGRLDKDSQGLIFLTNDGDIVNKILRAGNNHEKEYIVTVDRPIDEDFITKMSKGIPMLGTVTKKCHVEQLGANSFKIILVQGLNRQIRRMCEFLEYQVIKLKRVRIMNVKLAKLGEGDWRPLSDEEMTDIFSLIENSSKTEEASIDKKKKRAYKAKKWGGKSQGLKREDTDASHKKSSPGSRTKGKSSFKKSKKAAPKPNSKKWRKR